MNGILLMIIVYVLASSLWTTKKDCGKNEREEIHLIDPWFIELLLFHLKLEVWMDSFFGSQLMFLSQPYFKIFYKLCIIYLWVFYDKIMRSYMKRIYQITSCLSVAKIQLFNNSLIFFRFLFFQFSYLFHSQCVFITFIVFFFLLFVMLPVVLKCFSIFSIADLDVDLVNAATW